jgi:Family of unknown function (DUF5995)
VVSGVDLLAERMAALLASMDGDGDPARFFLGTYLRTTRAVGETLARGRFEDSAWVSAWVVDFADRYLDALLAFRSGGPGVPRPWQLAFGADSGLPPEAHVLLGMNAHINYDLPGSLVAMVPPEEFADPFLLDRRRRDHERIDGVLSSRVSAEDVALEGIGGRRGPVDRLIAPANRKAARTFLKEARRKVWLNAGVLNTARLRGPEEYARRLADLEAAAADRVRDLLRRGPVLLRLAVRGFGVTIPPGDRVP